MQIFAPMTKNYGARKYQHELSERLLSIFRQYNNEDYRVEIEWKAFKEFNRYRYSPEVDIAIGPFNDETASKNLRYVYNDFVYHDTNLRKFLSGAFNYHAQNMKAELYTDYVPFSFQEAISQNENARCLLAIEIENTSTKKHIMGSIVNAASLGRVGIGIGYEEKALKAFLRIVNYLSFLKKVEKNT
mgnify:CR=1 FL=1